MMPLPSAVICSASSHGVDKLLGAAIDAGALNDFVFTNHGTEALRFGLVAKRRDLGRPTLSSGRPVFADATIHGYLALARAGRRLRFCPPGRVHLRIRVSYPQCGFGEMQATGETSRSTSAPGTGIFASEIERRKRRRPIQRPETRRERYDFPNHAEIARGYFLSSVLCRQATARDR